MSITFTCSCGKQLRVGDDHAGRKIRCPGCDKSLRVPDGDDDPPKRDEVEDRAPRRGKKKAKRSALPMLLAAVAGLLVVVGGGGFAGYWFFLRGENMSESAFLPADAQALLTIRIADVAKVDGLQKLLKAQGGDSFHEAFSRVGLVAADVERMTMIVQDFQTSAGWAVVKTSKPYDKKEVLGRFKDPKPFKHEGKTYHVGQVQSGAIGQPAAPPGGAGPGGMLPGGKVSGPLKKQVVFFAGPNLLVLTEEESSIQRAITSALRQSVTGPLAEAVQQVGGPKHVYGAFNLPPAAMGKVKSTVDSMGPQMKVASALLQCSSGTLSMDIGDSLVMDASLKYADEGRAKAAMNSFTALKGFAELFAPDDPKTGEAMRTLLAGLSAEPRGAELAVKLKVSSQVLGALMQAMPGGAGGVPKR